jgi:hypothetical protein
VCVFSEKPHNRHGGWASSLSSEWNAVETSLRWETYAMQVWCAYVPKGGRLQLPATTTEQTVFGFAAASDHINFDDDSGYTFNKIIGGFKNGAKCWHDRGYQYNNVPDFMEGWTYFQGSHKAIAEGTVFIAYDY